ncbi:MAG: SMP-30/gluconolactonase/LRE family protein [Chakrabartia sp.]
MTTYTPETLIGLGQGLRFTESPRWHDDRLWFTDIHGDAIKSVDLTGDLRTEIALTFKPNGLGFLPGGAVVFADALDLKMKRWEAGQLEDHADLAGTSVFCLSDSIADAKGRIWVGDIGYNFWNPDAAPAETCVIARIDPDGRITKVADKLRFPNGLVITPDGKTLVVAETNGFCLTAYDIAGDGSLTNRRIWATLPDGVQPDGICLDASGAIWVANPGEAGPKVLRVREGGEVLDTVALDTHGYAVAIGGPHGRHLFICASDTHDPAAIAAAPSARMLMVRLAAD